MEDHARLAPRILERREVLELKPGEDRVRADRFDDRAAEDEPRRRQPEIKPSTPPQRLAEGAGDEARERTGWGR